MSEEETVAKRIRIERKTRDSRDARSPVLPLDPRDPAVMRAKAARRTSPR